MLSKNVFRMQFEQLIYVFNNFQTLQASVIFLCSSVHMFYAFHIDILYSSELWTISTDSIFASLWTLQNSGKICKSKSQIKV